MTSQSGRLWPTRPCWQETVGNTYLRGLAWSVSARWTEDFPIQHAFQRWAGMAGSATSQVIARWWTRPPSLGLRAICLSRGTNHLVKQPCLGRINSPLAKGCAPWLSMTGRTVWCGETFRALERKSDTTFVRKVNKIKVLFLRKKGSKTKKRMKEEEIEKGDCRPPTREVFFWDFVGLEPSGT